MNKKYGAQLAVAVLLIGCSIISSNTASAFGRNPPVVNPPLPAQPQAPNECAATFRSNSSDPDGAYQDIFGRYYLYSCTDFISLVTPSGQPIGAPYHRVTEYLCYGNDAPDGLKNKCQKKQTVSDPAGRTARPGNSHFSENELRVVEDQLIRASNGDKLRPLRDPLDPFEDIERDNYLHPIFMRLMANDRSIEYAKRELGGVADPYLDAHVLCTHPKTGTGSNYRNDQEEGQYFETDKDIADALIAVADKIRLRLVEVAPS